MNRFVRTVQRQRPLDKNPTQHIRHVAVRGMPTLCFKIANGIEAPKRARPPQARLPRRFQRLSSTFAWRDEPCETLTGSSEPWDQQPKFVPSEEQMEIARLAASQNVLVAARPGSGKTATIEAIVKSHPTLQTCALLYSKQLQEETRSRLAPYDNCTVSTFHGMAGKLIGEVVPRDQVLYQYRRRAKETGEALQWTKEPFDIIVLDEFQDCTDILWWLACQFIQANNRALANLGRPPARLVVFGDELQCIFDFLGADARFLTKAATLLAPFTPYEFAQVPLSRSFRLSTQNVNFLSETYLHGNKLITSNKEGPKPLVLRSTLSGTSSNTRLLDKIASLVLKYGAENSAIIAPTIKSPILTPLKRLVNGLKVQYNIPINVSNKDDIPLDERVTRGKLCVSSIHQFKGRERDLVIVFGIDYNYFNTLGRGLPHDKLPNAVFVGLTRARQQLVIVHKAKETLLPCASATALYKTAEVVDLDGSPGQMMCAEMPGPDFDAEALILPKAASVEAVVHFMPDHTVYEIIDSEIEVRSVSSPLSEVEQLDLPSAVRAGERWNMYETTSDLNGKVVNAAVEHDMTGGLTSVGIPDASSMTIPSKRRKQYVVLLSRAALRYDSKLTGYIPRWMQMRFHSFDWIRPGQLATAVARAKEAIEWQDKHIGFEVLLSGELSIEKQDVELLGHADIIVSHDETGTDGGGPETLWELKFVQALNHHHVAQACMYAYLRAAATKRVPRVMLFNMRDGEMWEAVPRDGLAGLRRVVEKLLVAKYTPVRPVSTEAFIRNATETTSEVAAQRVR